MAKTFTTHSRQSRIKNEKLPIRSPDKIHPLKEIASDFIEKSTEKAADRDHRQKINFNIGRYNAVVPTGKQQFTDINLAREKAKNLKWKAIESLDAQLEKFEAA